MSLGDSIGSSLGRAIGASLSGGGWSPLSLFQNGEVGCFFDGMTREQYWANMWNAGEPATVNGPVGFALAGPATTLQDGPTAQPTLWGNDGASNPATVNNGDTYLGVACSSGTLPAGGNGMWFSHIEFPHLISLTSISVHARWTCRVALSRALDPGEEVALRIWGNEASPSLILNGATAANTWITVSRAIFALNNPPTDQYVICFPNTDLSSPITLYFTASQWDANTAWHTASENPPTLVGTPTGGNLVANGAFDSSDGWSEGAGWSIGAGVATALNSNASLDYALNASIGRVYRIRYTLTVAAGTLTPSFGGVSLTARTSGDVYEEWITATSTAALAFAASGSFSGNVDNVVIHDCSSDAVSAPFGLHFAGNAYHETAGVFDLSSATATTWIVGVRKEATQAGMIAVIDAGNSTQMSIEDTGADFEFTTNQSTSISSGWGGAGSRILTLRSDRTDVAARVDGLSEDASGTGDNAAFPWNYITFGNSTTANPNFVGTIYAWIILGRAMTDEELFYAERWVAARTPGAVLA